MLLVLLEFPMRAAGNDIDQGCLLRSQIIIWDISRRDMPAVLLDGAVNLTCACFAPTGHFGVVAGSATGVLTLWDLRKSGEPETGARYAVFRTAANISHQSTIIYLGTQTREGNTSCQIISVDDSGMMIIWRIIESQRDERVWLAHATTAVTAIAHGAMSNIDDSLLGQRPGGTLHLTCLHSLALWSSVPSFLNDLVFQRGSGVRPRVVACVASPMDSDQYLASLNTGHLLKFSRTGVASEPSMFFASTDAMHEFMTKKKRVINFSQDAAEAKLSDISPISDLDTRTTCLDFSPFEKNVFIVGQLDGGCRLHRLDQPTPVFLWPYIWLPKEMRAGFAANPSLCQTVAVTDVKWSPHESNTFFVLCSNGNLHIFDLNTNYTVPVRSCILPSELGVPFGELPPKFSISQGFSSTDTIVVASGRAIFVRSLSESKIEGVEEK